MSIDGVAWMIIWAVVLCASSFVIDWTLDLDKPLRAGTTVAAGVALAWCVWRRLLPALMIRISKQSLALLVEKANPQLQDRLISLVQFDERDDGLACPDMIAKLATEANTLAKGLDFSAVIDRRGSRQALAMAAAALLIMAGLVVWHRPFAVAWMQRNLLLADVDYPRRTYIDFGTGDDVVMLGDDYPVVAKVLGRVPDDVMLHVEHASGRFQVIPMIGGEDNDFRLDVTGVLEDFDYYVTGGDDNSGKRNKRRVSVVHPPRLTHTESRVEHLAYRQLPAEITPPGASVVHATPGGTVRLRARCDKPLASAHIIVNGERVSELSTDADGLITGAFDVPMQNEQTSSPMRIVLLAADGSTNKRQPAMVLDVSPDAGPKIVYVRRFGVGNMITPGATIGVASSVSDDCSMAGAAIKVLTDGQVRRSWSIDLEPASQVQFERILTLQELNLSPGSKISVTLEARDNMPARLGGPNVTQASNPLEFDIVRPEELMNVLLRRQRDLRVKLTEALALQEAGVARLAEVSAQVNDRAEAWAIRELQAAGAIHLAVSAECRDAAQTMRGVRDEMKYNNLADQAQLDHIETSIIVALQSVADDILSGTRDIPTASQSMDTQHLRTLAGRIEADQRRASHALANVIEQMAKAGSKQEVESGVLRLIEKSRQLLQQIDEIQRVQDESLFD